MNIIYKFKVYTDEQDDFLREIEIEASQTFEDLHYAVLKAAGLESDELASFYICDNMWEKGKEITLLDMSEEENQLDIMSASKLKDFIENPDQKILYEYNFLNPWTFFLELVKVKPPQPKTEYPVCVKKKENLTIKKRKKNNTDLNFEDLDFDKDLESFEENDINDDYFDGSESEEGFEFDEGLDYEK